MGKLSSNYPHVDSYPEYTKIFAWYLNTKSSGKDLTSDMGPVIVFTNGHSVVSISQTLDADKLKQSPEDTSCPATLRSPTQLE